MSRAADLYRLQTLDSRLDAARARLQLVEAALARSELVEAARRVLSQAEADLQQNRRELREAEAAVRAQSDKIAEIETRLYGGKVKNPKELQDLQHDAEALKRHRGTLEDRQLDLMGSAESAEAKHALARAALATAEAEAEQANAGLAGDKRSLEGELQKLAIERDAAAARIGPDDLAAYNTLRARKRGTAVSRVEDGVCTACGVAPSSSRLQDARQGDHLIRCGNCDRILFAD